MRRLLFFALSNFFLLASHSQSSVWKVESNGNTLYIGGTVHVLRPSDYPLPKVYEQAYEHSGTLVFEADIRKMEDPKVAQEVMINAMYTDGKTLQTVLDTEVYAGLEAEATKLNLQLAAMANFKPSIAVTNLAVMKMRQMGISAEGVDMHFMERGITDGKKSVFFESPEEQITMLARMGEGNENEFVKYSLRDFQKMEIYMSDMIEDWKKGTSKFMAKQIEEMKRDFPSVYESLLVERNKKWVPKLRKFLESKEVEFVLVGTLHLYGPDGVLKMLGDKGCKLTQLH